jgi:hypothetical protein
VGAFTPSAISPLDGSAALLQELRNAACSAVCLQVQFVPPPVAHGLAKPLKVPLLE